MRKNLLKSMDEMSRTDPDLRDIKTIQDRLANLDPTVMLSAQILLIVRNAIRSMREDGRWTMDLESMSADDICDFWLARQRPAPPATCDWPSAPCTCTD